MSEVTIYHNPRCSKSRQTLELLRARGIEPRVVEYLKTPLAESMLSALLDQLELPVQQLVREQDFRELLLPEPEDEQGWIAALAAHPEIMQRPVVVAGDKARLGRPPENVLEIL
ncbi:MAG: arsenate reductase (glutaredoxin) [Planctomycetaceae bacterium]|nr:arsenate reductase (glutaredoxin) [Planctomycetaceae bacterium]